MILNMCKWTVISPAKKYQNSLKRALLRRKKLHWPRYIGHPVCAQLQTSLYAAMTP